MCLVVVCVTENREYVCMCSAVMCNRERIECVCVRLCYV